MGTRNDYIYRYMCQNGSFGGVFLVCQVMLTIWTKQEAFLKNKSAWKHLKGVRKWEHRLLLCSCHVPQRGLSCQCVYVIKEGLWFHLTMI